MGRRRSPFRAVPREPGTCVKVDCIEKGGACVKENDDYYCMDHLKCVEGTCGGYVAGGECDENHVCIDDNYTLYCDTTDDKCHLRKGAGESCKLTWECSGTLFCNTSGYGEETGVCCSEPTKAGDACQEYSDHCPQGTICYGNVCREYPSTVGADCDDNVGCNGSIVCVDSKCVEYPKGGDPCYFGSCSDGYYCEYFSKICIAYLNEGDNCTSGTCANGLHCANGTMVCASPVGEGEYCLNDEWCRSEFFCSKNSVCEVLPEEGMSCKGVYRCADGLYCDNEDGINYVCKQYPGLGEDCSTPYKCRDDLICTEDANYEKKCFKNVSSVGEYCSSEVVCEEGLKCDYNKHACVNSECFDDFECIQYISLLLSILLCIYVFINVCIYVYLYLNMFEYENCY